MGSDGAGVVDERAEVTGGHPLLGHDGEAERWGVEGGEFMV